MPRGAPRTFMSTLRRGVTALTATVVLAVAGCASGTIAAGVGTPPGTTFAPSSSTTVASPTGSRAPIAGRIASLPSSRAPLTSNTPAADPTALTGITWLLVRAVIAGVTYQSPQPGGSSVSSSYTVQFSHAQVHGNDACNGFVVAATVAAHVVSISGDISMSGVGCQNSKLRAAYDRALFHGSISWAVSGGRLTLTTAGGGTYQYIPMPAGYPSDLAGTPHPATAEKSIDGIRYRIYPWPSDIPDHHQCLTMEFNSPAGTPWEPVAACRTTSAAPYVGDRMDLVFERLPSGTGVVFNAVPTGTTSRIVFRPSGGGPAIDLNLTPLPGTAFQAFYGFIEHPTGGGTLTFYDAQNKPYKDVWKIAW